MRRSRSTLRRIAWLVAITLALWFTIAERVADGELEGTEFHRNSMHALEAALESMPSAVSGQLRAGAARTEIAPPVGWGVPLAGNRQLRFTRAEGKHPESVWARALALQQGSSVFLLISADIMVIHPALNDAVLERVRQEVDIGRGQMMLVAAHTHSGPGGYWQGTLAEWSVGPFQRRLFDFLVDRLAAAGVEAWRALEPVQASSGGVSLELPIQNRAIEGGLENTTLGVVRFESLDDGSVTDLVNYSAHPTNLIKGNRLFTGDYPALVAQMAQDADADRALVFTVGTIGDQKPWFKKERNRRLKAQSIADVLYTRGVDSAEPLPLVAPILETLEFAVRMPPLQPRILRSDWIGSWAARGWISRRLFPDTFDRAVVQVARLGRLALIGAPSDLGASLAAPLIERARGLGLEVAFVSMAEEWIGYVLTREQYEQLDYKEQSQFHGPLSGPLFSAVYTGLIDALAERASADEIVNAGGEGREALVVDATE